MPRVLLALLGGLLIGVLLFAACQVVYAYVKNEEFETAVRREARLAKADLRSVDTIREDVYRKAQDLGLPLEIRDITVRSYARTDGATNVEAALNRSVAVNRVAAVDIDVAYAVPVKIPGWTFVWSFQCHADDREM